MAKFVYPVLNIKSKSIFYKRISNNNQKKVNNNKILFEECLKDFEKLWKDNLQCSNSEKGKWVRDCSFSKLKRVVSKIDQILLKPFDSCLPKFIHGSISDKFKYNGVLISRSPQTAAKALIDGKKKRWMLNLDLQSFFESVPQSKIVSLFQHKFKCSESTALFISEFCCIKKGKKGNTSTNEKVVARGFSPSGRLAIWASLDFFLSLNNLVKKELKGHSPKLAIFVDDIGITAINVSEEILEKLASKISKLAIKYSLKINEDKKKILSPLETKEFVGSRMHRYKIFISGKSHSKKQYISEKIKSSTGDELRSLKSSKLGIDNYEKFTKKVSLS